MTNASLAELLDEIEGKLQGLFAIDANMSSG
jgi:hypothetical protein